jgi:hypothetical protein
MNTLLLDTVTWDLVIDAHGNIAMASNPYALAQDAASAIKTFQGEVYYDTTQGVPYQSILGKRPNLAFTKKALIDAALTVPEVVSANCFLTGFSSTRTLSGQVQTTSANGQKSAATF